MAVRTMSQAEVRQNFRALTRRVLDEGAEVHFGHRGRDEVTMIASESLAELKRLAQKAVNFETAAATPGANPWAGLQQALRTGQLGAGRRPILRKLPADFDAYADDAERSSLSWDEMARRGSAAPRRSEFTRRRASR